MLYNLYRFQHLLVTEPTHNSSYNITIGVQLWMLYPKKIYPYRSIGTSRRHQLRQLFPVCITALSAVLYILYTAVAVCQYNCHKPTVQLYRQGKDVSINEDGVCLHIRIYLLWSYLTMNILCFYSWLGPGASNQQYIHPAHNSYILY